MFDDHGTDVAVAGENGYHHSRPSRPKVLL
jgi:hypothetical protein